MALSPNPMVDQAIPVVLMLWSGGVKEAQDCFVNRRLGVRFLSPAPFFPFASLFASGPNYYFALLCSNPLPHWQRWLRLVGQSRAFLKWCLVDC
ncbi:hypothetical protein NSPZN2_40700 [Nitrospira defluvii]|uniref:Uncharacterized protein n=1 Tax=Nitrospira defluvii TaxID=330214 RepID=A0ABM8RZ69_9BACT|nr:hypothetical protein NSPZN2_40700 [Nitrospira defluvii]